MRRVDVALAKHTLFCNNAAMGALKKELTPARAAAIFISFTAYFYVLLFTLLPFLKANFDLNPALYWFITGYFLFVPLLKFAAWRAWAEGNRGPREILQALHVKPFTSQDWKYSILGLLLVLILTGGIFGASWLLRRVLGWEMLSTTPWFMTMRPFTGPEKLLLLIWLPMFFFNIVGEELLWRGYVQGRLPGKFAWLLCSVLWLLFHIPFGPGVMLMALPALLIIPYVFDKTRNTLTGIFIHALFNGPAFIAIALGL
jgi:membrane protease YdiL (CAAX protease family)